MTSMMRCTGCRNELDHCHGVLIVFADGHVECDGGDIEGGCDAERARHDWVVLADDLSDAA